jgi:hypothetical protein
VVIHHQAGLFASAFLRRPVKQRLSTPKSKTIVAAGQSLPFAPVTIERRQISCSNINLQMSESNLCGRRYGIELRKKGIE